MPLLVLARDLEDGDGRHPVLGGAGWGFLAGLVEFLVLLVWIRRFGVLPWVALSVVQALTVSAFVAGVVAWGRRPGRAPMAATWWVALEVGRGAFPLGGFPWGLLGATQHDGGVFLPVARTLGVAGVSAVLVLVGAGLEEVLARSRRGAGGRVWVPVVGVLAVVAACLALGALVPLPSPTGRTVDIAGVQGNDVDLGPVTDREDVARAEALAERQLVATATLAGDPPEVVVWPENSLDTDPRQTPEVAAIVDQALALLDGGTLLAGALLDGPRERTFLNTVIQVEAGRGIVDVYAKRILVPFGEYVPFRSVFGDFPPLRVIVSDGVPGEGARVFDVDGAAIGPVTCFESIFPRYVHDQVNAGAELLVVSTNNASFGRSAASAQHLAASQLRAVETGRWVLHTGISGVSGVVDPAGRVTQRTELFERAVVRADLPLVRGVTPATRLRPWLEGGVLALGGAGLLWTLVTRGRARLRRSPD